MLNAYERCVTKMIAGQKVVHRQRDEAVNRLRSTLALANCTVVKDDGACVEFQHGSSNSRPIVDPPKTASVTFNETARGTQIVWRVTVAREASVWLCLAGVFGCWAIFPPIMAYRALTVHPREFMENIMDGI